MRRECHPSRVVFLLWVVLRYGSLGPVHGGNNVAYKKEPAPLPFVQPVHWRFKELSFEETRRHWRKFNNSKPKQVK